MKYYAINKLLHSYAKILLVLLFKWPVAKLGYYQKKNQKSFPKSHYYLNAKIYDFITGLHAIPQNRIWLESKSSNVSIRNGELIPWITYSGLNFLEQVILTRN